MRINIPRVTHHLLLDQNTIRLEPNLEHTQGVWYAALSEWTNIVCGLRIMSPHADSARAAGTETSHIETFEHIAYSGALALIQHAYERIHSRIAEVRSYLDKWWQFQSLWDLQPDQVWQHLGEDLDVWLQGRINAKYDAWQRDLLARYVVKLRENIILQYEMIRKSRLNLEQQTMEQSTAEAVAFVIAVRACREQIATWSAKVNQYTNGQAMLHRQHQRWAMIGSMRKLSMPNSPHSPRSIIRRVAIVNDNMSTLRSRILAEEMSLQKQAEESTQSWNLDKPIQGHLLATDALRTTTSYETLLSTLIEKMELVRTAREATGLESSRGLDALPNTLEEVKDLSTVWNSIQAVWSALEELRAVLWSACDIRKTRSGLDGLNHLLRELPNRYRTYAAYEHMQHRVSELLQCCPLLGQLKSEAVRERHWLTLLKSLSKGRRHYLSALTLGQVLDLGSLS
ncbi:hypothetical protein MRB53_039588 [Persea americana]|nr:hypothetical protein MRB53_039588 [Persea americana]